MGRTGLNSVGRNGTRIGIQERLNFIEGSNISLTIAEDQANGEIDITINNPSATAGDETADNLWRVVGSGDGSKKVALEVDGITTATTRTLTVQDKDGTIALTGDPLDQFAATTSAELAGVISDETGTGVLVFGTAPTLTGATLNGVLDAGAATSFEIPNSATPTVNADGEIALDTTVADFSHGIVKYFGGEEMGVVAMPIAQFTSPGDGEVIAYNATNDEFELADLGAATLTFTNKTFDANGTGNSLSNVDVADLANGTDGELITWAADATPATVAVGTSGQVLQSNGAGAAPTFEDNSGSGAFAEAGGLISEAAANFTADFVVGSPQIADDGNTAHDNRMFYDKGQGGFRAGRAQSIQWNTVGLFSAAFGSNCAATTSYTFAAGNGCTASGLASTAFGEGCSASAPYSIALGQNSGSTGGSHTFSQGDTSSSTGAGSVCFGTDCISSGVRSFVHGFDCRTDTSSNSNALVTGVAAQGHYAEGVTQSIKEFSARGDSQAERVLQNISVTDATPTELTIGNNGGDVGKIVIPASRSYKFTVNAIARQTAGSSGTVGDTASFELKGVIKRDASDNTTLVGSVSSVTEGTKSDAAASSWTLVATADDTNESIALTFTGEADKTIHVNTTVDMVEVG